MSINMKVDANVSSRMSDKQFKISAFELKQPVKSTEIKGSISYYILL